MTNILVHGLGQNSTNFNKVKDLLSINNIKTNVPDLFEITADRNINYENMYKFST